MGSDLSWLDLGEEPPAEHTRVPTEKHEFHKKVT